jgi:photosystem II stability/assembly factor-like uncharacterized protein
MKSKCKYILIFLFLFTIRTYPQQQWLKIAVASNQNLWKCSFIDTLNGWAVGDSGAIVHTTDGGYNWVPQNSNLREYMVNVKFLNKRLGWALAWGLNPNYYGTYILKTTNGGNTWDTASYPIADTYIQTIVFLDSLTGYMGGGPGILLKSTNGGATWNQCSIDTASIVSRFPIRNFRYFNSRYGFAMGGIMDIAGVLWRTTNSGLFWTAEPVAAEPVNDLKFFDSLNILAIAGDYEYGASILKTSNGGQNWIYKNMGIFGVPTALSFRTNSEGWASMGYLPSLLKTTDQGTSWFLVDSPDSVKVFDLVFLNNRFGIGVGLEGKVIKFDFSSVSVSSISSIPYTFYLSQNYPNPFNPGSSITYSVPDISSVEIKVYNLLGEEINTIYKGIKSPGSYTIRFSGNNLPSGVYFYRLSATNLKTGAVKSETKKMILLK